MEEDARPLDETQFYNPGAVQFYGGISAENVHLYFLVSPFCDPTSNNKVLEIQAGRNPNMHETLTDRTKFEAALENMGGLEYRIVEGPLKTTEGMNPVWVFRKQDRQKRRNDGLPDIVTVLGTYYAIGDKIYQAPSLQDIVKGRLMAITNHLTKLYDAAISTQFYSPPQGHSYYPPNPKPNTRPSLESARASRAGTPIVDTSSQSGLSQHGAKDTPQANDDNAIYNSFRLALQYGTEYMDENPLQGEPGSFVMATTGRNLVDKRDREQKDREAAQAARGTQEASTKTGSMAPTPTPAPGNKSAEGAKKAALVGAKARSPISPIGDGGVKKRRKSRAPGSPGMTSPTSPAVQQP